jgi:hypothetical protein
MLLFVRKFVTTADTQPEDRCHHFQVGLPSSGESFQKAMQTNPDMFLHGDSKSSQTDNED